MNLFDNKEIRIIFDNTHKKHWFSAIDICAAIRDTNYKTARNYWKWLKNKLNLQRNQPVNVTNQLKLPALDGKMRYTDVLDAKEVLHLIRMCPSPKADKFRLWVMNLVESGQSFAECLIKSTEKCVAKTLKTIGKTVGTLDNYYAYLVTVTRRNIPIHENSSEDIEYFELISYAA